MLLQLSSIAYNYTGPGGRNNNDVISVKTDRLYRMDDGGGDDDAFWAKSQECKICSVAM